MPDLDLAVLRPEGEVGLAFMVSLLEAKGIPLHVKGAYFGGLYPGPDIEHYNMRTVLIPRAYLDSAQEVLAGLEGRGQLLHSRSSPGIRLWVVVQFLIGGWFFPRLPTRFRPARALALGLAGALFFLLIGLVVMLLASWWQGMASGRI